jgi:hypothetical protein
MECITVGVVCCVKAVMLIWGAKQSLLHNNLQVEHTRFCDSVTSTKLVKTGEPITDQSLIQKLAVRAKHSIQSLVPFKRENLLIFREINTSLLIRIR